MKQKKKRDDSASEVMLPFHLVLLLSRHTFLFVTKASLDGTADDVIVLVWTDICCQNDAHARITV